MRTNPVMLDLFILSQLFNLFFQFGKVTLCLIYLLAQIVEKGTGILEETEVVFPGGYIQLEFSVFVYEFVTL